MTAPRKKAAALRYEPGKDSAPRIAAAGQGYIAERILEAARQHHIPIEEDPELAAALSQLDVGSLVPPELYAAAAEVLAFVYRLDRKAGKSGGLLRDKSDDI
ncbi:MAG: EscU/YscU/HrcU family type III secretion system export apparatus switch protein [Armatimonadetes bacterium]|nr:EscU/YscU/HrcU family type III secretion system export apparatus switch protein [Armatimonadota bacterium]